MKTIVLFIIPVAIAAVVLLLKATRLLPIGHGAFRSDGWVNKAAWLAIVIAAYVAGCSTH